MVTKLVPVILFNFLAWVVGLSNDEVGSFVQQLTGNEERRALIEAQVHIYLVSKGRKLMPKHVSLGMVFSHLL